MNTFSRGKLLSKDQRNKLYLAIVSSKLNPAECEYKSIGSFAECIFHRSSSSEFLVERRRQSSESYLVATRTVADVYVDRANRYDDFDALVSVAKEWAETVAKWIDIPEFWENPPDHANVPSELTPESGNTPFTPQEQKEISDQLKAISETVKQNYDLTAEQSAKLDEKFEEAEKASRRMGRKDWGLLFGGAVFSLILADVITPGVAGHILMMIEHGLGHLFGAPPVGGVLSAAALAQGRKRPQSGSTTLLLQQTHRNSRRVSPRPVIKAELSSKYGEAPSALLGIHSTRSFPRRMDYPRGRVRSDRNRLSASTGLLSLPSAPYVRSRDT